MGFQLKTIVLSLQDQWPCNRVRWWAILAPKELDLTDFVPCRKGIHFSTIQHVIPDWPLWDTVAENQLQLNEVELTFYTDSNYGLLQQSGTCPTLLHSYGSVLRQCPCGCRQAPFNLQRLQRGGIRGCYIISQVTGKPRYLHTSEAALLCTIPVSYKFPGDARAGLVLIGQVAAPLQAQWVCAHLVRAVQAHYGWEPLCQPQTLIQSTTHELLLQKHHLWATDNSHATRQVWLQKQPWTQPSHPS